MGSDGSVSDLLKHRLEAKRQVSDNIDKVMQRWEQRIRPGNIRLADRFLNFNLNILLNVRFDSGECGVFCFHQISAIEPIGSEKKIVGDGEQGTVLVDVVKLVDSPERIIPASVRFESVDSFFSLRPHSVYFSNLNGFVLGHALSNRKTDLPINGAGRQVGGADKNELLCEMIQGGSEIVNNVSGDANRVERKSRDSLKVGVANESDGVWRDTRLWISMDYCRVCKGKNLGCEITEMLLGPFNLYLNENEPVLGI